MPVTIKRGGLKFRDASSGEYIDVDVVGERKTSEQIADIEAAGAAERSAIQTKGEQTRASIPADYTDLSDSVDGLKSAKADKVGVYPDLTAGTASQILSKTTVEDQVPYTFRQTGGGQSVGDRARLDKIVGGTVAWNQLYSNSSTWVDNGSISYSGRVATLTANKNGDVVIVRQSTTAFKQGHVAIISGDFRSDTLTKMSFGFQINWGFNSQMSLINQPISTDWAHFIKLIKYTDINNINGLCVASISSETVVGSTLQVKDVMCLDLTQMFGATIADYIYSLETATAGAGIAWFRQLFPLDYYDYNPGELISVSGVSARETVGRNLWDGTYDTRKTLIDSTTGEVLTWSSAYHASNYIDVIGGQTYYFNYPKALNSSRYGSAWYDADKNYISGFAHSSPVTDPIGLQTAPKNARYLRTTLTEEHLGTACISLSSSLNGTYEPYQKHTYPLDASLTLRGIPKLDAQNRLYWDGDEYTPDGKVTRRYGVVDLGTLAWSYQTSGSAVAPFFKHNLSNAKYDGNILSDIANFICPKYITTVRTPSLFVDKSLAADKDGTATQIQIKDSAYTDADAFKAAMSGVYLVYELATPTTETASEYQDIQIVDPYGTESFVTDGIVPVGHVTQYHENLREKIEQLPADFSTLIAPVEKTFVATRPYTSGALLIVNNVLYKATASIANGATITPGTNCTPTTLAAIIAALQ